MASAGTPQVEGFPGAGDRFTAYLFYYVEPPHLPEHPLARRIHVITGAAEDAYGYVWFSDPEHGLIRVRNTRANESPIIY